MIQIIDITGKLIIDKNTREWCKKKYPGHPYGCPNYGISPQCPPNSPMVYDFININKQHWLFVINFNIKNHISKMKSSHPNWTDRQCRNPYYWQNGIRKQLKDSINEFKLSNPKIIYTLLPESMGVNLFRTVIPIGIKLKKNPTETIYKIALVGYSINQRSLEEFC